MARRFQSRDTTSLLAAAGQWINACLIGDSGILSPGTRWTQALVIEVRDAFVGHPDLSDNSFIAKLKGQMKNASGPAQQLMAEMLWALLLFPSNTKARTKRQQVTDLWALSAGQLAKDCPYLGDEVLRGVGSGGPAFNTYRPEELTFLIALTLDLKCKTEAERRHILSDYDIFMKWMENVPQQGNRQFRHMLRYFAFPDRVERISSNNDRRRILEAFEIAPVRETSNWSDRQLDDALMGLRAKLESLNPGIVLDFYETPLKERWARDRRIKTVGGEVTVIVPDDDEVEEHVPEATAVKAPDLRQSLQVQAKLVEIGAIMGFRVWTPPADRGRIKELISDRERSALLETLPLNYDNATLDTIEQIDVLWLSGRSIVRAFEVEHTTAVYSGLLRMADLLALQPNMDIRLHIVAPVERREKVFREMQRPVFSLLERRPLKDRCSFISYEGVDAIRDIETLPYTNDGIIAEYEEHAES